MFENSQKFSFYQINNRIYNCNVWLENSYGTFLVIFNHSVQPTKPTFVQADTKILWWWSKVSSNQQLVKKWENFFSWSGNPIFPFTLLRPINVSWVVRVAPNNQISSPLLGDLILVSCCKKSSSPNMLISTCFYSSSFSSGFHFLASGLLDPYLWSSLLDINLHLCVIAFTSFASMIMNQVYKVSIQVLLCTLVRTCWDTLNIVRCVSRDFPQHCICYVNKDLFFPQSTSLINGWQYDQSYCLTCLLFCFSALSDAWFLGFLKLFCINAIKPSSMNKETLFSTSLMNHWTNKKLMAF